MNDIVQLARERAISYRDCGPSAEHTAAMLNELASHVERLRAELAAERATTASLLRTIALIREAGGLAREDLDALPGAVKAMRQQRDEARIRVCELCVRMGGVYRRINREVVECKTSEEIAEVCGWDCYAQQEGVARE